VGDELTASHLTLLRRMASQSPLHLHASTARALERRGLITVETTLTPLGSSRPSRITWGRLTGKGREIANADNPSYASSPPVRDTPEGGTE
jgi:hypothetical protein